MADDGPLSADFTTLEALKRELGELANAFDNAGRPLADVHDRVVVGCRADFEADVRDGAAAFLLSWQLAFRTMSDGAGLVANNIGKQVVDLTQVDASFTSGIQL